MHTQWGVLFSAHHCTCYDQYIHCTNKYRQIQEVQWWALNRTSILCFICVVLFCVCMVNCSWLVVVYIPGLQIDTDPFHITKLLFSYRQWRTGRVCMVRSVTGGHWESAYTRCCLGRHHSTPSPSLKLMARSCSTRWVWLLERSVSFPALCNHFFLKYQLWHLRVSAINPSTWLCHKPSLSVMGVKCVQYQDCCLWTV